MSATQEARFPARIGGYSKDGFENLSRGVDGVLGVQTARLKMLVGTGAAQSAAS